MKSEAHLISIQPEEESRVNAAVDADRQNVLDAAIVRIMKATRRMKISKIQDEVRTLQHFHLRF